MKPAPFEYVRVSSVTEALQVLGEAEDATVLAGGQSLVTMMNLRLARPALVVDIDRLGELERVFDAEDSLVIGALVRHRTIETHPLVAERVPLARAAVSHVGHVGIRNRGTLGGALAHADPAGELPLVAVVAGATVHVESASRGRREIAAEAFFLSHYTADLEPDELVTWVRLPTLAPRQGWAFVEHARRHGDYGVAGAAVLVTLDHGGAVSAVRAGLLHAADRPLLVSEETDVVGTRPTQDRWGQLAHRWAQQADPAEDAEHVRAASAATLAAALHQAHQRAAAPTSAGAVA